MLLGTPLLSQIETSAGEAASGVRTLVSYGWQRLAQFDDPRTLWFLIAGVAIVAVVYVLWCYRIERESLSPGLRWLLPGLRLVAIAGAILFYLGPEKRIDQQRVRNSQVVVLVDTSQSMSVEDETARANEQLSRSEAVRDELIGSNLIDRLRSQHDVSLESFDQQVRRVSHWDRLKPGQHTDPNAERDFAWAEQIEPRGAETRLGDALRTALGQTSAGPLAGIVVVSDGGHNGGIEPLAIADAAHELRVPVYTVGVGSTKPRRNLRVQELSAPSRVYPEDRTTIRGLVQGEGFAGRTVDVELVAREADAPASAVERIGVERVSFTADGEVVPVQFDIEPSTIGRLVLELRIDAPTDDQYPLDNHREIEVEVVEAETRVLLIASGPTRDYRFLRNQLRRDRHATVDVWLQSAQPGISQDADRILDGFPTAKEAVYEYDCIVAFDPDWTQLDAQQVDILESWVAEEAGGLIVVAGPIYTATWVQSPEHMKIRALYPVEFQKRLTLLDDGQYGSTTPWPIDFSREGQQSDFLWLADTSAESQSLWERFAGVFGCYAVKGPKPGARVLGRYSDPDAGISAERPIYMAEQFYGSGRVLYIGSGEMWRLRMVGQTYFEVLYTKMIRHVSQGRLLRGSSRGQLLVERDRYSVGDEVVVRAQLSTASREPLVAERVSAQVIDPAGHSDNLVLAADPDRPGNFIGQFDAQHEGSYRINLQVPDAPADEQLVRRIQVVVPNLEFEKTRRNETLLSALATRTGGHYYATLRAAWEGSDDLRPIASSIESREEIETIRGTADERFEENVHKLLLIVICAALGSEWLVRRLIRLA